ncbi:MAG: ABC transporter substrate-binding protein [Azospirillum brasilense]|nr:MAG: ABC transporter substrate-binding protein [Azospirillum brasilense]
MAQPAPSRSAGLHTRRAALAGLATAFVVSARKASAATGEAALRIATSSPPTSLDPHFHNLMPNNALAAHVFDRLVHQDARQNLQPGLATAWTSPSDTVWEFTLRPGVRFHDGQPFTAADAVASLARAPAVPNSPGSFAQFLRGIASVEAVGPLRLRIATKTPQPLLPNDLSMIAIIPARFRDAPTEAFRTGEAMIGTGPFRFGSFTPGAGAELSGNPDYWDGAPPWRRVTLRIIPDDTARVAALAAGDVDLAEAVPTYQRPMLAARPGIRFWQTVSNRLIFLALDTNREVSPLVTDRGGKALAANPLRDLRVRRALSLALQRDSLAQRLMEGQAEPAGDVLAPGFFGASPRLNPDPYDPAMARKLLAEAGYPEGFRLMLQGSNNRFPNDDKLLQAVAQMLTRIGIETRAEALPFSMLLSQGGAPHYAYSAMLLSFGANTGESSVSLRSLIGTPDRETGFGAANRGRYGNPAFDALLRQAIATVAVDERRALLERASEMAMADKAILPVLFQVNLWATRPGFAYQARADEWTLARYVTSTPE